VVVVLGSSCISSRVVAVGEGEVEVVVGEERRGVVEVVEEERRGEHM
jgi:hypothetical protein